MEFKTAKYRGVERELIEEMWGDVDQLDRDYVAHCYKALRRYKQEYAERMISRYLNIIESPKSDRTELL